MLLFSGKGCVLQVPNEEKKYSAGLHASIMRDHFKADEAKELLQAPLPGMAPIRILSLMASLVFISEFLVMIILHSIPPMSLIIEAMVDAGMLIVILIPSFYFFHYKPLLIQNKDRKQLLEKLIMNEERLNLTLDAINDGLWDWDIKTGNTYFSSRWETMLGYAPGEIKPHIRSWENLIHPDDRKQARQLIDAHFSGDLDDFQSEIRMQTKSGQWYWVLVRGKIVLRNRYGKPLRALGTHTDIHARKTAENALNVSRERIQLLSHQLINNSEEEKKHLAQELHDEFGQLLTAFQLGVEMIQSGQFTEQSALTLQCVRLLDTIKHMEKELRRICDNLRPDILDDIGLNAALEWLINQFSIFSDIQVSFNSELGESRLSQEKELVFYRICQETLNNISKHASASHVTVDLKESSDEITLTIRDNGCGFNPEKIGIKSKHWGMGLLGMHERAAALSGNVTIKSESGKGTTIMAALPKTSVEVNSWRTFALS